VPEIVKPKVLDLRSSDSAVEGDLDVRDCSTFESPFEVNKDVRAASRLGMNRLQGSEGGLIQR
jgi:hypothetical protein